MGLSSPNRMVQQYFRSLRRLVGHIRDLENEDERRQDVAICIMLAVTVVEAFLNIFFRVVVSESEFKLHEARVIDDLKNRRSLDRKLRNWPADILGRGLDFNSPIPKAFLELKDRRNALMHFTSSHETIRSPGIEIQGLADTSIFDNLAANDAINALAIAEGMVQELCLLRGIPEEQIGHELHLWTGKVPI